MEIFQTIWIALTTQNEFLTKVLTCPLYFVDAIVNMLLFTTILNINASKKSKIFYCITIALVAFVSRNFIPNPYGTFINLTIALLLIKFVLKATILKTLVAEFLVIGIGAVLELFIFRFYLVVLHIDFVSTMSIPIYRVLSILFIYLCIYIIYHIIKYCKFHINLDMMSKKSKVLFAFTTVLGILAIGIQLYLISFFSDTMPIVITIISILSLISYFAISIYSFLNTTKLETTSRDLEEANFHNKTLTILHDTMRGFKHDFHNIVQGLGGYIDRDDMPGLKKYYRQLLQDCDRVNNLTALSPDVINNPAIYNIMADKYHKADQKGIHMQLGVFMDLNEIEKNMKIYEFTRILGILLDNAMEAAVECKDKKVEVSFRKEDIRKRLIMTIENTYANKDINTEKIFEKSFSTKSKKTNSGLGLWEVRQILSKNNNLDLFTTKDDELFRQQFSIYY